MQGNIHSWPHALTHGWVINLKSTVDQSSPSLTFRHFTSITANLRDPSHSKVMSRRGQHIFIQRRNRNEIRRGTCADAALKSRQSCFELANKPAGTSESAERALERLEIRLHSGETHV